MLGYLSTLGVSTSRRTMVTEVCTIYILRFCFRLFLSQTCTLTGLDCSMENGYTWYTYIGFVTLAQVGFNFLFAYLEIFQLAFTAFIDK